MKAQPSILIVDDEPNNFDVIETFLDGEGYELHYASNGQKALDRLEVLQPDVILLDVMMPDMNGIEVCHAVKANSRWKHIPIVVVTALNTKEDLVKCLSAGASDFISKPIDSMELRARVRSMLQIKGQYDDLQALLQLREDMVSMMVHDLRNPLASILLSADLLRLRETTEHQEKILNQMTIAGQQMQFLIDSLLLMAKLESGQMALTYTVIDLHALCLSAVSSFKAIADQKKLTLTAELPELGGSVTVDAAVFRRIIDNLLSNAIKFSPRNSQVILQANYLETGGATVRVVDHGPGVSEELRQRIFEKFEIGLLVKDAPQIGLGLAFCKLAIEAHGGQITVGDNQPKGTVFSVILPPPQEYQPANVAHPYVTQAIFKQDVVQRKDSAV